MMHDDDDDDDPRKQIVIMIMTMIAPFPWKKKDHRKFTIIQTLPFQIDLGKTCQCDKVVHCDFVEGSSK